MIKLPKKDGESHILTSQSFRNHPAIYDKEYITEVRLPSSITEIGEDAFLFCDELTSITIPEGVKKDRS